MEIDLAAHQKDGLYLYFPDGKSLDFSKERIQQLADYYWNNPEKLPEQVRADEHFKTCTVCSADGQKIFCPSMKPLLPFLEEMESYLSCTTVTAVYVRDGVVSHVPETDMQKALQYVTNMSLFEYCDDLKNYRHYFHGIDPFMTFQEAGKRLFLNVLEIEHDDHAKVTKVIKEMSKAITRTSKSCVKRLNLMCKSDAFMNGYVLTQSFVMVLSTKIERMLKEHLASGTAAG